MPFSSARVARFSFGWTFFVSIVSLVAAVAALGVIRAILALATRPATSSTILVLLVAAAGFVRDHLIDRLVSS